MAAESIFLSKNIKTLNSNDLVYHQYGWDQCSHIWQVTRRKCIRPCKEITSSWSLIWGRYEGLHIGKNDRQFLSIRETQSETNKLVERSRDRKMHVQRSRKTMLRICYTHIVSLHHVIWVIRSLFRSFQSYFYKIFLYIHDSIVVIETI